MSHAECVTRLRGSCHCAAVRLFFASPAPALSLNPRACDCSFCRKHGASWLSDPHGTLRIEADSPAPALYRQGTGTAQFVTCSRCGVLVAVLYKHQGITYGAANASCLDDPPALGPPLPVSPQTLSAEEKAGRWQQLWVPQVELLTSGA
ncbi:MAG: aldehyde-activating protein [Proteobacteria bacterium]|nr:aldehyde-activating protein [Pseudomonadota bacterium]